MASIPFWGQVLCHEFRVAHPSLSLRACEELSYGFVCIMYGHWKMVASLGVSPAHNRVARCAMDRLILGYSLEGATNGNPVTIWSSDT